MANFTYTESITGGNFTYEQRVATAKADAQAIADSKGQPVTGTYILSDGERFTYTAYPSGTPPEAQGPRRQIPSDPAPPGVHMNPDTTAMMQRGQYRQPGFYGSQELSDSNDSFNKAVDIGANLAGLASLLQAKQAPPNYVRTPQNYILTEREKEAIRIKSTELASFGVIPYDVLLQFFYILAANESLSDLIFIADVVGIPELGQPRFIKNIRDICLIPDIYKIGYLANGVASVNNQFAAKYSNMQQYDDPSRSSIGSTLQAVELGTSLGVLGSNILSTTYSLEGYGGPLRNYGSPNAAAINSSINAFATLASNNPITSLAPAAVSAILNPAQTITNVATSVGASVVSNLLGQSPLGGALSALGPLGGIAASVLLNKVGGQALGGFMSEVITGSRIATSKLANNPMLQPPSYAGKAFFGEAPVALPAVDQVFCRKVGAFGTTSGGGGCSSFGMQNFASFGGSLSIASVASRMLTGSSAIPSPTTFFGQQVASMTSNLCSNLNVPTTASIEMRRSDNAIPFMLGLSAAMVAENFSPFGSKPFSEGWKLASSTANDVQRYNPQYLETCRTSL